MFQPSSTTAEGITGPIRLSGYHAGKTTLTFGDKKTVVLTSVGGGVGAWDAARPNEKTTGEIFRLSRDPGPLNIGNFLCGNPKTHPARYIVFLDGPPEGGAPMLRAAVFWSKKAPRDINSPGLCATLNYTAD